MRIYLKALKNGTRPKMAEMFALRRAPDTKTDKAHRRINRSGLTYQERAYVAQKAKAVGLPAETAYDPTLPPGHQFYETRAQADAAIAADKAAADKRGGRPVYRLHPRLVNEERRNMIAQDPKVATRDQREVTEQILDQHALPLKD